MECNELFVIIILIVSLMLCVIVFMIIDFMEGGKYVLLRFFYNEEMIGIFFLFGSRDLYDIRFKIG